MLTFRLRNSWLFLLAGILVPTAVSAQVGNFWLTAIPNSSQGFVYALQRPGLWGQTYSKFSVFQVHVGTLAHLPDANLAALIQTLDKSGKQLAIASPILDPIPGCKKTESFAKHDEVLEVFNRIKRLGGNVRFVALDEPLWYGSASPKLGVCALNLTALAQNSSRVIQSIRQIFPNAEIGDIEPSDVAPQKIIEFSRDVSDITGFGFSFVHVDVDWQSNWMATTSSLRSSMQASNIRFGIIIDGGAWSGSDDQWSSAALKRYNQAKLYILKPSDDVIFSSWEKVPHKYVPSTEPGTMSNLMLNIIEQGDR